MRSWKLYSKNLVDGIDAETQAILEKLKTSRQKLNDARGADIGQGILALTPIVNFLFFPIITFMSIVSVANKGEVFTNYVELA